VLFRATDARVSGFADSRAALNFPRNRANRLEGVAARRRFGVSRRAAFGLQGAMRLALHRLARKLIARASLFSLERVVMVRARVCFRVCVIVSLEISLAACGGSEEPSVATPAVPTTVAGAARNAVPLIGGTPLKAVVQGTSYAFTPTVMDRDGDPLTFTIANAPAWASFNSATGRLSGTPSPHHLGVTAGVVITVSDGVSSASLPAFDLGVLATAPGSATLSWLPPTVNTDDSPLTDLKGYKVYWGPSEGDYPNSATLSNAGLTRYVIDNLTPGAYFFAATAFNAAGTESVFSAVASHTIE
jgi:hypothetical protein